MKFCFEIYVMNYFFHLFIITFALLIIADEIENCHFIIEINSQKNKKCAWELGPSASSF